MWEMSRKTSSVKLNFSKVSGIQSANLTKIKLIHGCFLVNFPELEAVV